MDNVITVISKKKTKYGRSQKWTSFFFHFYVTELKIRVLLTLYTIYMHYKSQTVLFHFQPNISPIVSTSSLNIHPKKTLSHDLRTPSMNMHHPYRIIQNSCDNFIPFRSKHLSTSRNVGESINFGASLTLMKTKRNRWKTDTAAYPVLLLRDPSLASRIENTQSHSTFHGGRLRENRRVVCILREQDKLCFHSIRTKSRLALRELVFASVRAEWRGLDWGRVGFCMRSFNGFDGNGP